MFVVTRTQKHISFYLVLFLVFLHLHINRFFVWQTHEEQTVRKEKIEKNNNYSKYITEKIIEKNETEKNKPNFM